MNEEHEGLNRLSQLSCCETTSDDNAQRHLVSTEIENKDMLVLLAFFSKNGQLWGKAGDIKTKYYSQKTQQ